MKKNIILLGTLIISSIAYSQVGINTDQPKATLDIKASPTSTTKIDGLIAPRLTGNELQAKDALYEDDQDATIIYATAPVTTITDKTTNVTSIGYYYFDKTVGTAGRWMKIANPSTPAAYQEPWNDIATQTPATSNTQNIYQMGSVGVSRNSVYDGTTTSTEANNPKVGLDVYGSVRFGARQRGAVGDNSFAAGSENIASGSHSTSFGALNENTGVYTFATGYNNKVGGRTSLVSGANNTSTANNSLIGGYGNTVSESSAFTVGEFNTITQVRSGAIGFGNVLNAGDSFAAGSQNVINAGSNGIAVFGNKNNITGGFTFVGGISNVVYSNNNFVTGLENKVGASGSNYVNNAVFGNNNTVLGTNTVVGGAGNKLLNNANGSFIAGTNNTIDSGFSNFAAGDGNYIYGPDFPIRSFNFVMGRYNILGSTTKKIVGATASGYYLNLTNDYSTAFGKFNANYSNAMFEVGSGNNGTTLNSPLTIARTGTNNWVAIGAPSEAARGATLSPIGSEKLRVYGTIQTAGANYPDYVFEDYFSGNSSINSSYKFKSIYDTENFIKENHHLPGVTSIKDLQKNENGYSFNITELSTQTLEKVEELYLHTIEQQKQIDELKALVKTQQEQINQLLKK